MIGKISYILYSILKLINYFIKFIFNKDLLLYFYTFISEDSYIKIIIHGKKINFYAPNHLIRFRLNTFWTKEPETLEWIRSFKKKNNTIIFWDIGANVGLYSIYSALYHKKNSKVLSFEPSVNNTRILARNININNLQNKISLISIPVGSKKLTIENFYDKSFIEGSAFNNLASPEIKNENTNFNKNSYKVLTSTLDELIVIGKLKIPNYIKIDVDGNEYEILNGAKKILGSRELNSILVELDENNKSKMRKTIKLLKKNNFRIKSINKSLLFKSNNSYIKNYIFEKITN